MVTVYWAIYFQDILNLTPTEAGSYTFLANAPVLFAAPIAGWLVDRYGPRLPVTLGFSCIFFALAWFVAFSMPSTIHQLIPALIVFGCGIPLVFTPSFVTLMSEIPSDKRGIASGMNSTLRQFGATLGVALFGTLLNTIQMKRFQVLIDANNQTRGLSIDPYEGLLAQSPEATSAFSHLPIPLADYVFQSAKIAYVEGFAAINLCAALMAAAGIIIAFFYLKNRTIHHQ
jgi:MFS family permease